jgi:hypothetical protein
MASAASCELSGVGFPFTTHVFSCPCCRNLTKLLSPQSFISHERTECDHCGQEYLIENDVAKKLTQ